MFSMAACRPEVTFCRQPKTGGTAGSSDGEYAPLGVGLESPHLVPRLVGVSILCSTGPCAAQLSIPLVSILRVSRALQGMAGDSLYLTKSLTPGSAL